MVGQPPPPADSKWQLGLYWIYVTLLATASIGYLAIASPIIRPTLPTHPEHLLFCIFAGIVIADAAAHAISDIAGIWRPHDLGDTGKPRRKFSVRKLFLLDLRRLLSHLTAVPIIACMSFSYLLLPATMEDRLFGHDVTLGSVFWNFLSQSLLAGTDVFGFFLTQDAKTTLQQNLHLSEVQTRSFEAAAILAGLKLYGLLIFVSALRVLGAPVVIVRTWLSSRRQKKRRKRAEA